MTADYRSPDAGRFCTDASRQKLAVTTGLPGSGKSAVASYMEGMGFANIGYDKIAKQMFGRNYPLSLEQSERAYAEMLRSRDAALRDGYDVVVETTAYNEERRRELLAPHIGQKYLIYLRMQPDVVRSRIEKKLRNGEWTIDDFNVEE